MNMSDKITVTDPPFGPWVIKGHSGNYTLCGSDDGGFMIASAVQPDVAKWLVGNGLAKWHGATAAAHVRLLVKHEKDDVKLEAKLRKFLGESTLG
jgi:hypothetical protein